MIVITAEESKAVDDARQALIDHPLFQRRAEIERALLDDLTRLTRKYGLELRADTRNEYGESYPQFVLSTPYRKGTEARYVEDDYRGYEFESVKDALPCEEAERAQYEAALKARREEDEVIGKLSRKIQDAHWKMIEAGRERHMRQMAEEYAKRKEPEQFICSCQKKCKDAKALAAHRAKTGHA